MNHAKVTLVFDDMEIAKAAAKIVGETKSCMAYEVSTLDDNAIELPKRGHAILNEEPPNEKFAEVEFLVCATGNEAHELWRKYRKETNWEPENCGISVTVGTFCGAPINISVLWQKVNGLNIAVWEPISDLVSYSLIFEWFDKNCNPMWGKRKARVDARNFHLVLDAAKEKRDAENKN